MCLGATKQIYKKSVSYQKKGGRDHAPVLLLVTHARSSFGMTPTQAIRDLLAYRSAIEGFHYLRIFMRLCNQCGNQCLFSLRVTGWIKKETVQCNLNFITSIVRVFHSHDSTTHSMNLYGKENFQ